MSEEISPEERFEYMRMQIEEMFSLTNLHFAKESLGHEPNRQEVMLHYIQQGGARDFREAYNKQRIARGQSPIDDVSPS